MNRALIFAACLVPRAAVVLLARDVPLLNYQWDLSAALLQQGQFSTDLLPTTVHEPGYAAFLAVARFVTGDRFRLVMLLQALVGAVGGVFLYALTRHVTGRERPAVIAGLLYAFYPYYVRQSWSLVEVTVLTTVLVGTLWQFQRARTKAQHAAAGAAFGILMLTRMAASPLWLAAVAIRGMGRDTRRAGYLLAAGAALVMAPWMARSALLDGSVMPTRVGENLYVSTNPWSRHLSPAVDVDLFLGRVHQIRAEAIARAAYPPAQHERIGDRALLHASLAFVREQPLETLWLKVRNLAYVFAPVLLPWHARDAETSLDLSGPVPRLINDRPRRWYEYALHTLAASVVTAGAAVGLFLRRRHLRTEALLPATIVVYAVTYAVFFPTTRLLAPMHAVLMVYAGIALARPWEQTP